MSNTNEAVDTNTEQETVRTCFLTYHWAGKDMHIRTDDGICLIEKQHSAWQEAIQRWSRGQQICVRGGYWMSPVLSSQVLRVEALEVL